MLTKRQLACLDIMGIDVWTQASVTVTPVEVDATQAAELDEHAALQADAVQPDHQYAEQLDSLDWDALCAKVAACQRCELHQSRTRTVFGVGNRSAKLMIIGEAPGADEDRQGEPFVGKAGQLLNAMLQAIGLARDDVYIANILKCRPPNNRDPGPEESAQCWPYLQRQIQLLQPELILAVGRIAAQRLLKTNMSLTRMRGTLHQLEEMNIPVLVTFHPAYLLRSPSEKRKAWEDLLQASELLNRDRPS